MPFKSEVSSPWRKTSRGKPISWRLRNKLKDAQHNTAPNGRLGRGTPATFVQRTNQGLVVGTFPGEGGRIGDPRITLSRMLKRELDVALGRVTRHPIPVCTVYDAAGKPVATIDPVTRERSAL